MWLFIGLGNPGDKYAHNRHNIGFMAVDEIAHRHNFSDWKKGKFKGLIAEGKIGEEKVLLLKPQTYMNDSGLSVLPAASFYKISPENIIVFHDELDLDPGKIRIKQGGGAGGHNGLRSIDSHLGKNYWRVRMGIGHPGDKDKVHSYVLKDFSKEDKKWLEKLIPEIGYEAEYLIKQDMSGFMNKIVLSMPPSKPK